MKKVVVVIPVYKEKLSSLELISLQQANKVLSGYDKVFVAADGLHFVYADFCKKWNVERFDRYFFQNTETYSELLLSEMLYERFSDYEYMLIYQPDAFVFFDRLEEFCDMGYDYIGAPEKKYFPHWKDIGTQVGNGGLSLRKVQGIINVLKKKEYIFAKAEDLKPKFMRFEDLFFAYCSTVKELNFNVPDSSIAREFSMDAECGIPKNIDEAMPFGVHAWYTTEYDFWKKLVERTGYKLPEKSERERPSLKRFCLSMYICNRLLRAENKNIARKLFNKILPEMEYSIWGYGDYGRILEKILKYTGKQVRYIYDRNYTAYKDEGVFYPDYEHMKEKGGAVVVTPAFFAANIIREAETEFDGIHFLNINDIFEEMILLYCHSLWRRDIEKSSYSDSSISGEDF